MHYPLLNAFLTVFYFFLWLLWLYLLFWIIFDIFRSRDLSGLARAGWLVLVVLLPFIGVLVYLIARGDNMHERATRQAQADDRAFRSYIQDSAGTSSADDIEKLAGLRDRGVITEQEFERGKAKVLGSAKVAGENSAGS